MRFPSSVIHRFVLRLLPLLCGCALQGFLWGSTHAAPAAGPGPSWGALASIDGAYGYSFNHPTRSAAEQAARAQCDRTTGRTGPCVVRAYFDRSCAALANGNYGEWGSAIAATAASASQEAIRQCDNHLPTQPCKAVVSVCSPR